MFLRASSVVTLNARATLILRLVSSEQCIPFLDSDSLRRVSSEQGGRVFHASDILRLVSSETYLLKLPPPCKLYPNNLEVVL